MEKILTYNISVDVNKIIKTEEEQFDKFFYSGHPSFLIPDFNTEPDDIWLSFMDFLEKQSNEEIYDQNGGEITEHKIIDLESGLTEAIYIADGIQLTEDSDYVDYVCKVVGYVVSDNGGLDFYFIAIQVYISIK